MRCPLPGRLPPTTSDLMDLGDLLILLLFLFPVLSRLFGKKRPPQHTPSADSPSAAPPDDPLADALRQIREALGETTPEPPPPKPPAEPERTVLPPKPAAPAQARVPEFHGLGAYEHDEHGFGRSNPLSEETFERMPQPQRHDGTDRIDQRPLKNVDLTTPIEVKKVVPTTRSSLAEALQDPARAREAFVMYEVLGPPRSLRPRR